MVREFAWSMSNLQNTNRTEPNKVINVRNPAEHEPNKGIVVRCGAELEQIEQDLENVLFCLFVRLAISAYVEFTTIFPMYSESFLRSIS
jgi:hypothetical protein